MYVWFLIHCVVLISSRVAWDDEEEKLTMSGNNLILAVMQVKHSLAYLQSEMKYEVSPV